MPQTLEHPVITHINRTGYPPGMKEPRLLGEDDLGYDIYEGDELMVLDDYVYVKEELSMDAIKILEMLGAYEITAQ